MAHNLSLLRKLRLGFNASMVFFGMLVLILTGAMIGKYPDDGYGNGSPGFGYILVFGVPVSNDPGIHSLEIVFWLTPARRRPVL